MASAYPFVIFWLLYCLSFCDLRLLLTPLLSFHRCIVCPSNYGFCLPLCYLLTVLLSVLRFTAAAYLFVIFWPLYCLTFCDLQLLLTPLLSFDRCIVWPSIYVFCLPLCYLLTVVLSVLLWFTLLLTSLLSFHRCIVCPSIYGFCLPLCYLLTVVMSVLWFTSSAYPFVIFWLLYCLSFDLRLLLTPLLSFDRCIVCPSIYGFCLPLCYLLTVVLSDLRFTSSADPFVICW